MHSNIKVNDICLTLNNQAQEVQWVSHLNSGIKTRAQFKAPKSLIQAREALYCQNTFYQQRMRDLI